VGGASQRSVEHKDETILLGGYLHANSGKPRGGYAHGNRRHMGNVDQALTLFVESTGGKLISPNTPTRLDTLNDKFAILDHMIYGQTSRMNTQPV
jgi:hypothetical protein